MEVTDIAYEGICGHCGVIAFESRPRFAMIPTCPGCDAGLRAIQEVDHDAEIEHVLPTQEREANQ